MTKIPLKVWNRLDMLRAPIAAAVPSPDPPLRRWVAILSRSAGSVLYSPPEHQYCIWDLWYDAQPLAAMEPDSPGFRAADLEQSARRREFRYYVQSEAEPYAQLALLQIEPATFDAPWHVQHPYY
jgi:hypothetical protein